MVPVEELLEGFGLTADQVITDYRELNHDDLYYQLISQNGKYELPTVPHKFSYMHPTWGAQFLVTVAEQTEVDNGRLEENSTQD